MSETPLESRLVSMHRKAEEVYAGFEATSLGALQAGRILGGSMVSMASRVAAESDLRMRRTVGEIGSTVVHASSNAFEAINLQVGKRLSTWLTDPSDPPELTIVK